LSDKTEQPTPRRLRKAREEGDSGASAYAAQALAFTVAVAAVPSALGALAWWASAALRVALARVGSSHASPLAAPRFDPAELATTVVALTFPVLLAVGIAGAVAHAVQTGGVVSTKKLAPSLERLDPFAGFARLVSPSRLFAVARAIVASVAVAWLAGQVLVDHVVDLSRLAGRPRWVATVLRELAGWLAWRAALVGLAIGAVDVLVTRRAWTKKLRMTKDEVKREHRDAEGDPQLKAARERAYHELLAQVAIANVRGASVVVVNPTHLACALRYDARRRDDAPGDDAPVVVASGEGEVAARILQAANDHGVPVVRDAPLARALLELEVGQAIPEALYEAVAEILREVSQEGR
jgi:flagellar biosynthesis protein FlhB